MAKSLVLFGAPLAIVLACTAPAYADDEHEPQIIYLPPTAPPPVAPAPAPAAAPVPGGRPHSHRGNGTEMGLGLGVFGVGYVLGALIVITPALFTNNGRDPVENTGEKRLALIPVAGPMVWWFAARSRLDGRSHSYSNGVDSGFHNIFGLPYALVATAAQGVGAGLMLYAAFHSDEEVATTSAPRLAKTKVFLSPTPGGLSLEGSF